MIWRFLGEIACVLFVTFVAIYGGLVAFRAALRDDPVTMVVGAGVLFGGQVLLHRLAQAAKERAS